MARQVARLVPSEPSELSELRRVNEELQRLNEALLERREELETANAELEAFNFSVSHDLRNSLQAVLGFAQMLSARHRDELSPEVGRYLDLIVESSHAMNALIDDLLGFSQVNRVPLECELLDVEIVAREALTELESQLSERRIDISFGELPIVRADRILLKRVLVNLLSNAIKYTRGTARATIEISSFEEKGRPVVFVRDNGVGFDMKHSDRLFRAFERLHRKDQFEGTGVGLALVARIVERHGGRIWAESEPGKGACFYFTLDR